MKHSEISETDRLKLIDWIIDTHQLFALLPETLYLTVNIIDRYLSLETTKCNLLPLIGISAMFIASKYEEIYAPELRDFVYVTKGKFNKSDILRTEYCIMKKLEFNLLTISPLLIFNRLYFISSSSKEEIISKTMNQVYYMANFFLELMLLEYKMLKYSSSIKASSALFLARKFLSVKPTWPQKKIEKQMCVNQENILECSKEVLQILKKEKTSSLNTLKNKYSKKEYMNIYSIFVRQGSSSSSISVKN